MAKSNNIQPYIDQLKEVAKEIQASELLETYREEETDETYRELADAFEPQLFDIHKEVNNHYPLEIEAFENEFRDEDLEGLLLPRLLGFSVLRGYYGDNYKYTTPQDHFKDLLLAIVHSPNFDNLISRIGQTVQLGFALSSDIWITNLLDEVENKKIKQWLQSQKLDKYYEPEERRKTHTRYKNQFKSHNYFTAKIPATPGDFKLQYPSLKYFLFQRQRLRLDNSNIKPAIVEMLNNKSPVSYTHLTLPTKRIV